MAIPKDQQFQLLIDMSKELAKNTQATIGIEEHLRILNGKVAKSSVEISLMQRVLLIVGTAVAILLITNGSELIKFVTLLL